MQKSQGALDYLLLVGATILASILVSAFIIYVQSAPEDCKNDIDDNLDGRTDCLDSNCPLTLSCGTSSYGKCDFITYDWNCIACVSGTANCNLDNSDKCEVNINTDEENCGKCGSACRISQECKNGVCITLAEDCTNNMDDDLDGSIDCFDADCTAPFCKNTQYAQCNTATYDWDCAACASGTANCDLNNFNKCEVNTLTDNKNCGTCAKMCRDNESCNNGVCAAAVENCTNNIDDDKDRKIDCFDTDCIAPICASTQYAQCNSANYDWNCTSCQTNYANCNRDSLDKCEVNTNTDPKNCGSCGTVCKNTKTCINGECTGGGALLEFYGYWQLNAGLEYNDSVTDMDNVKDYTNLLLISLNNNHLNWPENQKTQIKEFINYASSNNLKLVFLVRGIKDAGKKQEMENRLKKIKCILEELNDEGDETDTNACSNCSSFDTTNPNCDYDGGYIANAYDKIFGFEAWEEPYWNWDVNCEHIQWWVDKVKEYFPKQKIFFEAGGVDANFANQPLTTGGSLNQAEVEKCNGFPLNIDYFEFFSYPYRKITLCEETANYSPGNIEYAWDEMHKGLDFIKSKTDKPIIFIPQAAGYESCSNSPPGPYNLMMPTPEQTRRFYDFAKSDQQITGLLWYIYRLRNEGTSTDGYGAHNYPETIQEHKSIWSDEFS